MSDKTRIEWTEGVTKPSGRNSWDRESRRAEDFRTDALNAITGMEVRS